MPGASDAHPAGRPRLIRHSLPKSAGGPSLAVVVAFSFGCRLQQRTSAATAVNHFNLIVVGTRVAVDKHRQSDLQAKQCHPQTSMNLHSSSEDTKVCKNKTAAAFEPQPWKYTKEWAEKRNMLEAKFCVFLGQIRVNYILPWQRHDAMYRAIGNTNKVLFIEIITHHLKKTAVLAFFEDESMGFLGIKGIFVSAENRANFDAGLIPSVDVKRRTETGPHIKTLVKIWQTAGFVERVLEGGALSYVFDQGTFDRMRGQAQRAEQKRRAAKTNACVQSSHAIASKTREFTPHASIPPQTTTHPPSREDIDRTPIRPGTALDALPSIVPSSSGEQLRSMTDFVSAPFSCLGAGECGLPPIAPCAAANTAQADRWLFSSLPPLSYALTQAAAGLDCSESACAGPRKRGSDDEDEGSRPSFDRPSKTARCGDSDGAVARPSPSVLLWTLGSGAAVGGAAAAKSAAEARAAEAEARIVSAEARAAEAEARAEIAEARARAALAEARARAAEARARAAEERAESAGGGSLAGGAAAAGGPEARGPGSASRPTLSLGLAASVAAAG